MADDATALPDELGMDQDLSKCRRPRIGWMGVHRSSSTVTTFPSPTSMSPSSGSASTSGLTFTFQDAVSAGNLLTAWVLINTAIDGRSGCYVAFYRPGNQVFLYPDNGEGTQAIGMVLSGSNSISNSQCVISSQGSSAVTSGAQLTLNLNITFKSGGFSGPKGVWAAVRNGIGQVSSWLAQGAWMVP